MPALHLSLSETPVKANLLHHHIVPKGERPASERHNGGVICNLVKRQPGHRRSHGASICSCTISSLLRLQFNAHRQQEQFKRQDGS